MVAGRTENASNLLEEVTFGIVNAYTHIPAEEERIGAKADEKDSPLCGCLMQVNFHYRLP